MLEYERDFGFNPAPIVRASISNHPVSAWGPDQIAACNLPAGELPIHIPFPNVSPEMLAHEVADLAAEIVDQICNLDFPSKSRIMVQGEMTLTYLLVKFLKQAKYVPVAATSERETVDNPDGTKTARFRFVQFREY